MKYRVLKPIPGRLGVWTVGKVVSAAILQRDGYDANGLVKEKYVELYDPDKVLEERKATKSPGR